MKRYGVLFILFASRAFAVGVELYPLNGDSRFERNEAQTVSARSPVNFAGGLTFGTGAGFDPWAVMAESMSGNSVSLSGNTRVSREHEELLIWLRRQLRFTPSLFGTMAGGLGRARDVVGIAVGADQQNQESLPQAVAGVSAGGAWEHQHLIRVAVEGRLLFSANFDPNPEPDVVLRLGLRF